MQTRSNGLLTFAGVLMIIGGAIGCVLYLLAVIGASVLSALTGGLTAILVGASLLAFISAIIELIAGIVGVVNTTRPEKAQKCIVFGLLTIGLALLGNFIYVIAGGTFGALKICLSIVVPALYLIGAFQNKSRAMKQADINYNPDSNDIF